MALKCWCGRECKSKRVTGGIFGISFRTCAQCGGGIAKGAIRHTCIICNRHFCSGCLEPKPTIEAPPEPPAPTKAETPDDRPVCKYGARCYNHSPEHLERFSHPVVEEGHHAMRLACKYGDECYQKGAKHRELFAHPGDRNYRIGLVAFKDGQQPLFRSVLEIFQFFDPDESGHLSKEEFSEAIAGLAGGMMKNVPAPNVDEAWNEIGGAHTGYINFRMFAMYAEEHLALDLPLGLESRDSAKRKCRFRVLTTDGERCSCEGFVPVNETDGALCECGHKCSMHRSDLAQRTYSTFLKDAERPGWVPDQEGLIRVTDANELHRLQVMMTRSHKVSDNWTRDRGCTLHGVNGCSASCASRNRVDVPSDYQLVEAYRNQNLELWSKYSIARSAIAEECSRPSKDPHEQRSVVTSGHIVTEDLDQANNEWYLFHGSTPRKCKGICSTNFRLAMAGSGATWKSSGKETGTPLYGFGIYFAERVTKADEYTRPLPSEEEQMQPIIPIKGDGEIFTVLLCRVIGGRTNFIMTNEIEVDKLRRDVFEGSFNSVFGDREVRLGKPYREIVVYDKDQVYPEFLLVYRRVF